MEIQKRLKSNTFIRQFISYFGVGGVSALVEWLVFSILEYLLDLPYLVATVIAFLVSTTTNWFLGRKFTFKNSSFENKRAKELLLIFFVSGIGLAMNMLLMLLFVEVIGMKTNLLKIVAKIMSTGIVFMWNFLSRKYIIYKM